MATGKGRGPVRLEREVQHGVIGKEAKDGHC